MPKAKMAIPLPLKHGRVEQIVNFLVVNLHEGNVELDAPGFLQRTDLFDELLHTPLDQAVVLASFRVLFRNQGKVNAPLVHFVLVAIHGVGLARTCLSVAEHCRVESIHNIIDEG